MLLVSVLDVDECDLGTDLCSNAVCANLDGSYACVCFPGFKQIDVMSPCCKDIAIPNDANIP